MSRILRFFALVAVVFFSVNAFAGDPYSSCSAKKVYTKCATGYVLQEETGECVPYCSAGQYWDGSACQKCTSGYYCPGGILPVRESCPDGYGKSKSGASSESECYKNAELRKNGGNGTCFEETGTSDGVFTCYYGSTCALPSWNSSSCNMTNGSKIFQGWSLSDDATTGTTGDFVDANVYYAVWVTPDCNITNGTGEPTSALNNQPRCNVTCNSGYGTSGTYTGSAGATSVSYTCTLASNTCSEGQYWNGSACVANTYTVSFDANGGTGGQTASVTATYGSQMPPISTTPPTRTGYTFSGWYDAETGGNRYYYSAGNSARTWDKTENTTLYAQWMANDYRIVLSPHPYNIPGTTDVYTTYDTNVYLDSSRSQAMTTNANNITKPTLYGYTFGGYYSEPGGTGTEYIDANGYITSAGLSAGKECVNSCTWYAKWIQDCYQITLDNTTNGGTGGTTVLYKTYNSDLWYSDSSCSTQVTTITVPTKTNASYTGHYTIASGSGTQYISNTGNLQSWTVTGPTTLYARYNCNANWRGSGTTISGTCTGTRSTVSFNANGGTGGQTASVTATYGSQMPAISTTKPTRTGYTFKGWYDAQTGGTQYYTAGGASARTWNKTANTTLYARWTGKTYTVLFDANGGTGGQTSNVTATYGSPMPTISTTAPTRAGYTFNGWYDFFGNQYYTAAGDSARDWDIASNTTLYAGWTANEYSIVLSPGSAYTAAGTTDLYTKYGTNVYLDSNRSQAMTIDANNITKPTRDGYTFDGYYSESGGTGAQYIDVDGYISPAGLSAGKECASSCTWYAHWTANAYTVKYNANGGSGTTASSSHEFGVAQPLTANGFTRTGYTFAGWATSASGDVVYTDQQSVTNLTSTQGATVNLYAKWTANNYSIKLNPRYTTSGTRTLYTTYDTNVYLDSSRSQAMTTNAYNITKPTLTGYTFGGYYSESDGTGTEYINANGYITSAGLSAGKECVTASGCIWYAKWTGNTYTVSFDANGGTGGQTASVTATYGNRMPPISTTKPTRTGYYFNGWYDAQTGGTQYYNADGSSARTWNKTAGATLYAQWTARNYSIRLLPSPYTTSGTGTLYTTYDTNVYLDSSRSQAMTTNAYNITKPTLTGYTFGGYYSGSGGTGTQYIDANGYITSDGLSAGKECASTDCTWYAKWTANTYTVSFNANGGSGTMQSSSHTYGVAKALTANGFTRTGYTFAGWATSSSGDVVYTDQQSVTNLTSTQGATVNLYAKWTANDYFIYLNPSPHTTAGLTAVYTTYDTNVYRDINRSQAMTTNANPIIKPTRDGYTFGGYYSGSGGTGTQYIDANGYITSDGLSAGKVCASTDCTWYAKWTANTYTVQYNANGGSGTTPSSSHEYGVAKALTANGFTRTGYTFAGWATSASGDVVYTNQQSVTNLTSTQGATINLYAKWTANNYSINLNPRYTTLGTRTLYTTYGTNVYLDSSRSQAMTTNAYNITKPTLTGYTFGGYYSESDGTGTEYINANGYITSDGLSAGKECVSSCTWYAKWTANTYTVSFNVNGGTGGQTNNVTATYGSNMPTISTTAPTRTGYTFAGWYDAQTGGTQYYTAAGTSARTWNKTAGATLYAQWTANDYSIVLSPGSVYTAAGTRTLYTTYDTNVYLDSNRSQAMTTNAYNITKPTRTGYTFAGYYSESGGTGTEYIDANGYITSAGLSAGKECASTTDCKWYAKWLPDCYEITLDNTTNGGTGGTTVLYKPYNSTLWYSDSSCSTQVTTITKPTKTNASYGSHYTRASSGGYQYIESSGSLLSRTVTGPITLYARYDCNTNWRGSGTNISGACTGTQSTVSFNVNGGTGGQTASVTATYGSEMPEISTTAPTRTGYTFDGWYSAQNGGNQYYTAAGASARTWDKTADTTLYARWTVNTYRCTSGQYLNVTSCETCTAGYYCPSSSVTYTYDGSVQGRTACGGGKYSSAGATSCSNITAGCYGTSASSSCPAVCAANTYSDAGASSCSSCPTDYKNSGDAAASHAGSASCKISVPGGKYVGTENSATLSTCSAGYYKAAHSVAYGSTSSCSACGAVNKYSSSGASSCSTVSSGYYTIGGTTTTRTGQSQCTSGYYCTGGEQKTCPTGYGASAVRSDAAADCYMSVAAAKHVAGANDASATACGTGTYKEAHTVYYGGTSTCNSCPTGYDDGAAASAESGCEISVPGGKYVGTENSATLSTCSAGYYKAAHSVAYGSTSSCSACGGGKYSEAGSDASSDCKSISAGCYGSSASSACPYTCAPGTYSTGGASGCTICGNKPTNSSYTDARGNTSADCPWTCNDGYNQTYDNQCGQFCTAGITHIKSSNGLSVPLYSSARTSPAINVKVNDSVCYGSLATGQSSGALNVRVGSTTYHAIN